MVAPLRRRQTKGAATDMLNLRPPRHTSTLPDHAVDGTFMGLNAGIAAGVRDKLP
jgi:hypothetical protein